jgi:DNA-binding transcriptional LysR family regulator
MAYDGRFWSDSRVDWTKLEVRHLQALRAVAREGSFGRAALELGYTQSAISQQIAALERIVGQQLVRRPKGRSPVSLTEAGRVISRHADAIIEQAQAARADLEALRRGSVLRIGTFQSTSARLVPSAIAALATRMPEAQVELHESQGDERLLHLIETGELDLTFCVLPALNGPFISVELLVDPIALVVSADHPLAGKRQLEPADLDGLQMIGFHNCRDERRIKAHLLGLKIVPHVVTHLDDNGAIQGLAAAGIGAALMPRLTIDAADSRVRVFDLDGLVPPRVLGIAWHRERTLSPAALAFIEAARRRPRRLSVVGSNAKFSLGFAALTAQPFVEVLAV